MYLSKGRGADVDFEDDEGLTALHCVAWSGRVDCVELLIKNGAYVNAIMICPRSLRADNLEGHVVVKAAPPNMTALKHHAILGSML